MRQITSDLKNMAIKLRQTGLSYSEIRMQVPVAKSTLSALLRDVELNKRAKKIIESKSVKAQKLGAEARRNQRINRVIDINHSATSQIKRITDKELFLMGIMLYWAEGAKIRERNISQQVAFGNSDPRMCKFFLRWLRESLRVKEADIYFSVYINSVFIGSEDRILNFWRKEMSVSSDRFSKLYFTRTRFSVDNKRKERSDYRGLLRIRVRKSVDLNRRIEAWIRLICERAVP
jgi:hypothetical protein